MKLADLVECSLPLLAEGKDDAYPYWFGGTCFLVRYQGDLFVVTANHCLKNKTKDEVRVQRHPASDTFLTLTALFTQHKEALHEDDPDQDDWAVLQVEVMDSCDPTATPLDLDATPDATQLTGTKLVVRGYPKGLSGIDYDALKIRWQAFAGSAAYEGRPSWSERCHTLVLDDVAGVESIDGLSGSPVFALKPEHGNKLSYSFAGMALRGSKESKLVHILEAPVVRAAVAAAHRNRRAPVKPSG